MSKIHEVISGVLKKEGKSKNDADDEFDPEQLKMGIEIEQEHSKGKEVAKEIAKDHLREHPRYYTYLKKMEANWDKEK